MKKASLISALAVGFSAIAHASGPLGDASTFNAFIYNNYVANTSNDVEGAIAVGGSILGPSNSTANIGGIPNHGFFGTLGSTTGISVYSGSSNTKLTGSIQGGTAYLAGSYTGNLNDGATVNSSPTKLSALGTTFLQDWAKLTQLSKQLQNLNGYAFNIDYSNQNNAMFDYNVGANSYQVGLGTSNNLTIDLSKFIPNYTVGGKNVYVLDMSDSELNTLNSKGANIDWQGLGANSSVIVNVDGGKNAIDWDTKLQNGENNYVLYNFLNASTITTNDKFTGSMLAINSSVVENGGELEGNVIAENLTTNYELHFDTGNGVYQGWVPMVTPEPAPFAALGLGALVVLRRRKKA